MFLLKMYKKIHIILIYLLICIIIYNNTKIGVKINSQKKDRFPIEFKNNKSNNIIKQNITDNQNNKTEDIIGYINISKLKISNKIYKLNSEHNNVDENVTILKESNLSNNDDRFIILAAHSGDNYNSYFSGLEKLELNDEIIIDINNIKETYSVEKKDSQNKNGYINIQKKPYRQLILTTCSEEKNGKQFIIEAKIKSQE